MRLPEGLPALPPPDATPDVWLACARAGLQAAGDAVHAIEPDVRSVAIQLRIARQAFSIYRLAKYRWFELTGDAEELGRVAYQVLEA